jgi:hypothetical protein
MTSCTSPTGSRPCSALRDAVPADRVIDGVDQFDWLSGEVPNSRRDSYLFWMGDQLYGVKWRDFKMMLVAQTYSTDPPGTAVIATDHQPRRRSPRA